MLSILNDCIEQLQSPCYTRIATADTERGPCLGLQADQAPASLSEMENWCKEVLQSTVSIQDSTIWTVHGEEVSKKDQWTRMREAWSKLTSNSYSKAHKFYRNTLLEQMCRQRYIIDAQEPWSGSLLLLTDFCISLLPYFCSTQPWTPRAQRHVKCHHSRFFNYQPCWKKCKCKLLIWWQLQRMLIARLHQGGWT